MLMTQSLCHHAGLLYSNCSEFVHSMVRMCDKFNPRERERVIMMARTEEDQKLKSPAFYLSELDLGQSYTLYAKAQYAHTQISYLH